MNPALETRYYLPFDFPFEPGERKILAQRCEKPGRFIPFDDEALKISIAAQAYFTIENFNWTQQGEHTIFLLELTNRSQAPQHFRAWLYLKEL